MLTETAVFSAEEKKILVVKANHREKQH